MSGAGRESGALAVLLGVPALLLAPLWAPLLRHAAADLFAVGGVGPDLAPVAAAAACWTRRPAVGIAFALALGASLDLASATPWGLGPARFLLLATFVTRLRRAVDAEGVGISLFLGAVCAAGERLSAALLLALFAKLPPQPLLGHAALVALYSAALAPLVFAAAQRLPGEGPE